MSTIRCSIAERIGLVSWDGYSFAGIGLSTVVFGAVEECFYIGLSPRSGWAGGNFRVGCVDDLVDGERAEVAIAFELALGEELVRRGLVRERGMGDGVLAHVGRLLPVHTSLDIDQFAGRSRRPVDALVVDVRDGAAK